MSAQRIASRAVLQIAAFAALLAALPYAPDAEARGGRRFGFFAGGVVVGAVLAPRYYYPAPYYYYPPAAYYPPPVYYPPYPTVTYVAPPVVVQQQVAPSSAQPASPAATPANPQQNAQTQSMSIEDRLLRLRSMCDQGLFTESECHKRREQILQEM